MKRIPKFLLFFVFLIIFVAVASFIFHSRIEKIKDIWLLYTILKDLMRFFPLLTTLAILWSQVFQNKGGASSERGGGISTFLFYTIFSTVVAFAVNEVLIVQIYESTNHKVFLQKYKMDKPPSLHNVKPDQFSSAEMKIAMYYPHKDNVTFAMGRAIVSIDRLYKVKNTFYMEGVKVIGYNQNLKLDYIVNATYGKLIGDHIAIINATYYEYFNNALSKAMIVKSENKIPIVYDMNAVYHLSSPLKEVSLLNVILNQDFIFGSKINFYQLSNRIFNKIAYYIIMIVLLIFSYSISNSLRNERTLKVGDIFQVLSFYVVSFVLLALTYDMLIRLVNMVYALVV